LTARVVPRTIGRMAVAPHLVATYAERAGLFLSAVLLLLASIAPLTAAADESSPTAPPALSAVPVSRIPTHDPLNGGFLVVNMHGFLFHPDDSDLEEDVAYARWLGSGVIRVFATDNNGFQQWDGRRVGTRIADIAPVLRAARVRLIVALVNNHRPVPGELPESAGWVDNYLQLLLPFFTSNWRGAYLTFARELISTVQARDALDVVYAWELGNELHTPDDPSALMPFITLAAQEIRALDPITPILPGTMGANHIEPYQPQSPLARWLYCEAPVDAYTLHAYDWVSRERPGDMPIHWDLEYITAEPCTDGRRLPVIVEELGTSRVVAGMYAAEDEQSRLAQELRQIQLVRSYPQVVAFGVWNGESPRLVDRTFADTRRGLTSYGRDAQGGGSCYDPTPDSRPGVRCELEQALRRLPFVRVDASDRWLPDEHTTGREPLIGGLNPVLGGDVALGLTISGWIEAPSVDGAGGVDGIAVVLGAPSAGGEVLAHGQIGLPLADAADLVQSSALARAEFAVYVPLDRVPPGPNTLTVSAHIAEHGAWFRTLQVVVPSVGSIRVAPRSIRAGPEQAPPAPTLPPLLDVRWPTPGVRVTPSFVLEGTAFDPVTRDGHTAHAHYIEVFLEPGRDRGGRLVGTARVGQVDGTEFRVLTTIPRGDHTLHVHARSVTTGREVVVRIPVVV